MTVLGNSSEFRARRSSHVYSGQIDTVDQPMTKMFLPLLISELRVEFIKQQKICSPIVWDSLTLETGSSDGGSWATQHVP